MNFATGALPARKPISTAQPRSKPKNAPARCQPKRWAERSAFGRALAQPSFAEIPERRLDHGRRPIGIVEAHVDLDDLRSLQQCAGRAGMAGKAGGILGRSRQYQVLALGV